MLNIRFKERANTWPGFVDLFSNLVIILIFLLIVFVFLYTTTSVFNKKNTDKIVAGLKQTNAEQTQTIEEMQTDLTNLSNTNQSMANELIEMDTSIADLVNAYEKQVVELQANAQDLQSKIHMLTTQLNQETVNKEKTAELEQERRELQNQMNAQRAQLAEQLSKLQAALDAAEEKSAQQEIEYIEMSNRLNKALADKVAELNSVAQYQSAFYRAIKDALGDTTSIQPDGDRFIVPSDILFSSGSYTLSPEGKKQLHIIANAIKDFENKIPSDINWIIRVDGHTDKKQVLSGTRAYKNNMELSLLRATAVADELVRAGISKKRLLPSGFGEMYPVAYGDDANSLQKNRRIELQLTNR